MKFMLLCYHDEQVWDSAGPDARQEAMREAGQLIQELMLKGQCLRAAPLHPAATATSVRVRDGKRIVTDGPFAETREVLGGFYLIDVADRDEAVAVAARQPGARIGTMEVRPVLEIPGLVEL